MKKTFPLAIEGRHPDRVLDALKHEIRKYLRRERRRALPEGVDFLDFDCRFGLTSASAQDAPVADLIGLIDSASREGAASVYVEILAKPGKRRARPPAGETQADADSAFPATVIAQPDSDTPD